MEQTAPIGTNDAARGPAPSGPAFSVLAQRLVDSVDVPDDFVTPELSEMLGRIAAQRELRFFVDGTRNIGHQASTLLLMRRLVDRTQYAGRVTIHYADYDNDLLGRTAEKLGLLLPGVEPRMIDQCVVAYGSCREIRFRRLTDGSAPDEEVEFGFTGGADDMSVDYAAALKVRHFVRIQPYLWDDDSTRKDDPYYESSRIDQRDGPRLTPVDLYPHFRELAFKRDRPRQGRIDDEVWKWFGETQQFDIGLARRTRNVETLWRLREQGCGALFWPIYGLQHFHPHAAEIALNLMLSAFRAQAALRKPIVAILFGAPDRMPGWNELLWPLSRDLEQRSMQEFADALVQRYLPECSGGDAARRRAARARASEIAQQVGALIGPGSRLTLLSGDDGTPETAPDISRALRTAVEQAGPNEIVCLCAGPVPMDVFNAWYAVSELPGVLEGQTTSSLLTSLGKPFLQMLREEHVIDNGYPMTLPGKDCTAVVERLREATLRLRTAGLRHCLESDEAAPLTDYLSGIELASRVMCDSTRPGNEVTGYFKTIGDYYQKDVHDKLLIGLLALRELLRATA